MFCIHVPTSEMPWPKKKRRKFRCDRAPKRRGGVGGGGGHCHKNSATRAVPTLKRGLGRHHAEANRVPFRVVLAEPTLQGGNNKAAHPPSLPWAKAPARRRRASS